VLIADDSPIVRGVIKKILKPCDDIEVVEEAQNGTEAVTKVASVRPSIVILDVYMPEKNGLQVIEEIMAYCPTPILVITAASTSEEPDNLCFHALERGALELIEKSRLGGEGSLLIERIRLLSKIPVISHIKGKRKSDKLPCFSSELQTFSDKTRQQKTEKIVLIGSSAGGPRALSTLLQRIPKGFSAPIIISQHIPENFSKKLASWLQENCALVIREAQNGELPPPGTALLTPGGCNLSFQPSGKIYLESTQDSLPITHMMKSAAEVFHTRAIGILLTGIGEDGAEGLLAIKKAGGYTLAEDASTCLVFGMPRKAIEIGAVHEALPGNLISERIIALLQVP
jgi:two-component system chemotaxis response regulator CheB